MPRKSAVGHGPVEVGVVLAVPHDRGQGPEAGAPRVGGQRRRGSVAHDRRGRGRASRPRRAPSWGCRGRPTRRAKTHRASSPRRPPPAARCRRCPGRGRRPGRRPASRRGRPAPRPGAGLLEHGQDGQDRLGGHRVGHPFEHPRRQGEDPDPGRGRPPADLLGRRGRRSPSGDDVHRLDGHAGLEGARG